MTSPVEPRRSRWAAPALIAILAAVIVVVVVIGVVTAASTPKPHGSGVAAGPSASASATPSPVPLPSASVLSSPKPSVTKAPPVPAGTPQPTHTAAITATTTIVRALTAKVVKTEAVQGKASGPGEVGGPSVRFTITITNTTGKTVNLSNTVVNAYFGKDATPAVALEKPGGAAFPFDVKDGATATGVFVFNIPEASRSTVEVTVDTSVKNPVVAFRGSVPR